MSIASEGALETGRCAMILAKLRGRGPLWKTIALGRLSLLSSANFPNNCSCLSRRSTDSHRAWA
eukprot:7087107-Pyramimonas_sp.AAC.1